jgi:hypothetical protein
VVGVVRGEEDGVLQFDDERLGWFCKGIERSSRGLTVVLVLRGECLIWSEGERYASLTNKEVWIGLLTSFSCFFCADADISNLLP